MSERLHKTQNGYASHPPRVLQAYTAAVFCFLYLPIVTLVVYSFNGAGVGGFPPAQSDARLVSHAVCRWRDLDFGR